MTVSPSPQEPSTHMSKKVVILHGVIRLILSGILFYAAFMKINDGMKELAISVANFEILPAWLVPYAAIALLGTELTLSLLLLIGLWKKEVALLTTVLFSLFTCAVISALIRGLNTDCGCFGKSQSTVTIKDLMYHDLIPLSLCIVLIFLSYHKVFSNKKTS